MHYIRYFWICSVFAACLIGCTIGGELVERPVDDKTSIIKFGGLLTATSGYAAAGRIQAIRSQADQNYYIEFSPDFSITTTGGSAISTTNSTVHLSSSNTSLTAPMQNLGQLHAAGGHSKYKVANDMILSAPLSSPEAAQYVLVRVNTTIVAYAKLNELPTTDTVIFRTAVFTSYGAGYGIGGKAEIRITPEGQHILGLLSNFTVTAPGPYTYLTQAAGPVHPTNADLLVGPAPSSGERDQTIPNDVNIFQYSYVLIHCEPFDIPLGKAKLTAVAN